VLKDLQYAIIKSEVKISHHGHLLKSWLLLVITKYNYIIVRTKTHLSCLYLSHLLMLLPSVTVMILGSSLRV